MKCAGYSNCGGREYNEDACKAWGDDKKICAVVADGLGGHGGGSIASRTIIDVVQDILHQSQMWSATEQEMLELIKTANEKIVCAQTPACKMKSTIVLLWADAENKLARWMHMGDSRLYHFENEKIVFYTFDHSVTRMLAHCGEISMDEIRFHEDRNRVLRSLGCEPVLEPEIGGCELSNKKRHAFLLCTDGFWEHVEEPVMEKTLAASDTPEQWLKKMRKHLCGVAGEDNDNHTAVAVWI